MNDDKQHILYADDEALLLQLAQRMLAKEGYNVTSCTDPRQALELFRNTPDQFDLIITDLSMPHLSGLDLVQSLREVRADIPAIITSGCIRQEDRDRAAQLGIHDLLMKPVSADALCRALDRALQH